MGSQSYKLDVGVVGAGIAGLSVAIGLCRAGHSVEVFERSRLANEVGAAINVPPNASRVLKEWNFDFDRAGAVQIMKTRLINSKTLDVIFEARYEKVVEAYGPWYLLHRADLHDELKRLAVDPGDGITGARLRLATEVKTVDCESGTLVFADGRTVKKDLIIAADGVHASRTRKSLSYRHAFCGLQFTTNGLLWRAQSNIASIVHGSNAEAKETGHSAFRFLIPTKTLTDAGLGEVLNIDSDFCCTVAKDEVRRLVSYPCRNGELMNFAAIHPTRNKNDADRWDVGVDVSSLLDEYKTFHPDLVRTCRLAEDLKLWKLLYRPPIATWYRDKVALAGDAAHPMLPHQGQGGAQAVEDAAALAVLFENISSLGQVAERLHLYQEVRQRRASAIQVFSSVGQDEAVQMHAEAKQYVDGPVPTHPIQFMQYHFSHDVLRAAQDALQRSASGSGSLGGNGKL